MTTRANDILLHGGIAESYPDQPQSLVRRGDDPGERTQRRLYGAAGALFRAGRYLVAEIGFRAGMTAQCQPRNLWRKQHASI